MKPLCIALILLVLAGCGNNSNDKAGNGTKTAVPGESSDAGNASGTDKDLKKKPGGATGVDANKKPGEKNTEEKNGGNSAKPDDNNQQNTTIPNDGKNSDPPKKTTDNNGPGGQKLTDNGNGDVIFVGVFARWDYTNQEHFDGSYDTLHNLFLLCGGNNCKNVPRNQIDFQVSGFCDTVRGNRIMLFKKTNGKIDSNGHRIQVQGDKGVIKIGSAIRVIQFDPHTLNRIKTVPVRKKPGVHELVPLSPKVKTIHALNPVNNNVPANPKKDDAVIPVIDDKKEIKTMVPDTRTKEPVNQINKSNEVQVMIPPAKKADPPPAVVKSDNLQVNKENVAAKLQVSSQVKTQPVFHPVTADTARKINSHLAPVTKPVTAVRRG